MLIIRPNVSDVASECSDSIVPYQFILLTVLTYGVSKQNAFIQRRAVCRSEELSTAPFCRRHIILRCMYVLCMYNVRDV